MTLSSSKRALVGCSVVTLTLAAGALVFLSLWFLPQPINLAESGEITRQYLSASPYTQSGVAELSLSYRDLLPRSGEALTDWTAAFTFDVTGTRPCAVAIYAPGPQFIGTHELVNTDQADVTPHEVALTVTASNARHWDTYPYGEEGTVRVITLNGLRCLRSVSARITVGSTSAPVINSVTPNVITSLGSVGTTITIRGRNFGDGSANSFMPLVVLQKQGLIGGVSLVGFCDNVALSQADREIQCIAPPSFAGLTLSVNTTDGVQSSESALLVTQGLLTALLGSAGLIMLSAITMLCVCCCCGEKRNAQHNALRSPRRPPAMPTPRLRSSGYDVVGHRLGSGPGADGLPVRFDEKAPLLGGSINAPAAFYNQPVYASPVPSAPDAVVLVVSPPPSRGWRRDGK